MYVAHVAAHWPMHAHQEDIDRYQGRYDLGWDSLRVQRLERMKEMGILTKTVQLEARDSRTPPWSDTLSHHLCHVVLKEALVGFCGRVAAVIGSHLDLLGSPVCRIRELCLGAVGSEIFKPFRRWMRESSDQRIDAWMLCTFWMNLSHNVHALNTLTTCSIYLLNCVLPSMFMYGSITLFGNIFSRLVPRNLYFL